MKKLFLIFSLYPLVSFASQPTDLHSHKRLPDLQALVRQHPSLVSHVNYIYIQQMLNEVGMEKFDVITHQDKASLYDCPILCALAEHENPRATLLIMKKILETGGNPNIHSQGAPSSEIKLTPLWLLIHNEYDHNYKDSGCVEHLRLLVHYRANLKDKRQALRGSKKCETLSPIEYLDDLIQGIEIVKKFSDGEDQAKTTNLGNLKKMRLMIKNRIEEDN